MSRWVAATMAAQVAATPAGVKLNRLATGTNVGVTAEVGARASRSRVTAGWVEGGEGGSGKRYGGHLAAAVPVIPQPQGA